MSARRRGRPPKAAPDVAASREDVERQARRKVVRIPVLHTFSLAYHVVDVTMPRAPWERAVKEV